ncbi:Aste57867_19776 [Aphanomyces stellatus]|uniref:Aste57867_19776 protein n=1 Tax=Aphanomyces stellatus TaxID=120398 RepID=A0A485LD85_9STRA|nr:hypothetical protein As57867_019711 [Aphanomyces stellatus]VFT96474.1 Aste57867_19776 [Aphanomyces stellatus]
MLSIARVLRRSLSTRAAPRAGLLHVGCNASSSSDQSVPNAVPVSLKSPVVQVFGSNTDVGKTLVSAGICRAAVRSSNASAVGYIKPLQTGGDSMLDARFLESHVTDATRLTCETLFHWETPVSPHLAARLEDHHVTDQALVTKVSSAVTAMQANASTLMVVETAGGVCSPSASGKFQCDVYRPLRLPAVLVGDGKLGGISATMSALESLLLRGYDIPCIVLIEQDELDNAGAIHDRATELNIPVFALGKLPPQPEPLGAWYATHDDHFTAVFRAIEAFHTARIDRLNVVAAKAKEILWWPFTQHKQNKGVLVIDSAYGDTFATYDASSESIEPMFDACASWWTQGVGHGNPKAALALATTTARYGHVMFPENAHEPAVQLSEKLLASVGRGWASRVFFSDDGSTAVEIAIKMAFRKFAVDHCIDFQFDGITQTPVVLAQTNCYHGDTLGAMAVAEPSVFNKAQHPWYKPKAIFVHPPTVRVSRRGGLTISWPEHDPSFEEHVPSQAALFDVARDDSTSAVAARYAEYVHHVLDTVPSHAIVGALLVEPVLIGAGGMHFVDPLFQRTMVRVCRERKIPVIFDEVFSGLWRLGAESARDLLHVNPDISCYAKLLTGGVVPLSTTLATEEVFNAFHSDAKADALLHGHSFTANPVGCAAAITALDLYDSAMTQPQADPSPTRVYWNPATVDRLAQDPSVARTFQLGTVVVVELQSSTRGYEAETAQKHIAQLRTQGIYARALGNVMYIMCSPLSTADTCDAILTTVTRVLLEH